MGIMKSLTLLAGLLLFAVPCRPAFSQLVLSPQSWGPSVGGLRIGLSIERGDQSSGGAEFVVAFENTGQSDFVLNLGSMLANGTTLLPTEVRLLVTDYEDTTRELRFFFPWIVGRFHPFTVPLRAGSTHTLRTSLRDYFMPTLDNRNVRLPAGRNRIVARFEGRRTQSGDSTIRDVDLLNFWQGVVESNVVEIEVPEDPNSPQKREAPSIAGCIRDLAGYGIPGVTLVAKGSGVERTAKSNATGCYEFRDLAPASYRVTARLLGFDNVTRDNVVVVPGAVARFDFTMHISPICECVQIAAPQTLAEAWQQAQAVLHVRITPPPADSTVQSGTYRHTVTILHALKLQPAGPKPREAVVVEYQRNGTEALYDPGQELVIFASGGNSERPTFFGLGADCCGNRRTVFVVRDGRIARAPAEFTQYVGMSIDRFLDQLRPIFFPILRGRLLSHAALTKARGKDPEKSQ